MMPQTIPRDRRPPDGENAAIPQIPGAYLDERLEDDEEGEQPERRGGAPVVRRRERARQCRPRVFQQPGQAHGHPGGHDHDSSRVAEDLFRVFADTEYPAGFVGDDLVVGINLLLM